MPCHELIKVRCVEGGGGSLFFVLTDVVLCGVIGCDGGVTSGSLMCTTVR